MYLQGVVLVEVGHLQRAEEGVEAGVGEAKGLHLEGRLGGKTGMGKECVSQYTCGMDCDVSCMCVVIGTDQSVHVVVA